ncbi:hypothetical protein F4775DRAFT_399996 [Biscogniauxia sp. FL1348]|nr:hypothetical protein F4775DRAFT_399996 [Biscogniauxia sp. FL1348]
MHELPSITYLPISCTTRQTHLGAGERRGGTGQDRRNVRCAAGFFLKRGRWEKEREGLSIFYFLFSFLLLLILILILSLISIRIAFSLLFSSSFGWCCRLFLFHLREYFPSVPPLLLTPPFFFIFLLFVPLGISQPHCISTTTDERLTMYLYLGKFVSG